MEGTQETYFRTLTQCFCMPELAPVIQTVFVICSLLAVAGSAVDGLQLFGGKGGVVQRLDVVQDLLRAGCTDQHTGHLPVLQDPGQRHLGQGLAAGGSDLVQGTDLRQLFLGEGAFLQEPAVGAHPAVGRDAVQIPVGEQALCQRAEGNDALAQTVF